MSKLFKSKKPKQPPPEPVAPVPDEELELLQRERDYQRRFGNKGRSGTVLSMGKTKLGFGGRLSNSQGRPAAATAGGSGGGRTPKFAGIRY